MRVLQLIDSLALGGAEVLLSNMVPAMLHNGLDCEIAVLDDSPSPLLARVRAAGVTVHSTGIGKLYSVRQIPALRSLFRSCDLIHVHLFPAQLWALLAIAGRRSAVPLVTTEHNTWNARRRWWLRPLDRWMYPRFHRVACNSEATAAELVRWCPRAGPLIEIIPNGIPLAHFAAAQPASLPSPPPGVPRLVFVGRFDPQKDHATIIRALPLVPSIHAILVGDGPLRKDIESLAHTLDVAQRVSFLGRRDDVPQVLKACDIYVHSTTSDGFGIAACEAMAAGLPVISSDVPGLAQVVEGAGILFPVGDHAALARLLNLLLSSPEQRARMSAASIARAQHFSIEQTTQKYMAMYQSLLSTRAGAAA